MSEYNQEFFMLRMNPKEFVKRKWTIKFYEGDIVPIDKPTSNPLASAPVKFIIKDGFVQNKDNIVLTYMKSGLATFFRMMSGGAILQGSVGSGQWKLNPNYDPNQNRS